MAPVRMSFGFFTPPGGTKADTLSSVHCPQWDHPDHADRRDASRRLRSKFDQLETLTQPRTGFEIGGAKPRGPLVDEVARESQGHPSHGLLAPELNRPIKISPGFTFA
jgi:hypothetical protein